MAGLQVGRVEVPEGELSWRFSRASGPGGQGVNTTDSRVELSYDLAGSPSLPQWLRDRAIRRLSGRLVDGCITVVASERRSQRQNRDAALARLGGLLAEAFAPPAPPRRATRPTRASVQRRLDAKAHRSRTKRDRRAEE